MYYLLFIVGVLVGAIITNIYRGIKRSYGTLKINTNDPDGPYLFLELSEKDLANIVSKKEVILQVKHISQK